MARYRRPRHQGVVYGPVRQREEASDGGFVGRILGILVVMGAVALLGLGALTFLGGESGEGAEVPPPGAAASPSPTQAAVASPSPPPATAPSPTASPTTTPDESSPSPEPQPSPTPGATPFEVRVEEGRGYITFGSGRASNLRIRNPGTTFEVGARPLYSARLTETTATRQVAIEVRKYDPDDGSETLVTEVDLVTRLPRIHTVRQRLETSQLDGAGIYVMRFVAGNDVLAEGWFELTD